MHQIRHFLNIVLSEANISLDRTKFWFNVHSGKTVWLGGMDHHAHAIYYAPQKFGLTPEQVAHLDQHPAMRDAPEDENGEPDPGSRIIYLPELFWLVMQHGWVRGGMEGEHSGDDHNVLHPYGLYLEGKSLPEMARAARAIAEEVAGDAEFPDHENDWTVTSLRLEVRNGPTGHTQSVSLSDERADFFMRTGRIPSQMIGITEEIVHKERRDDGTMFVVIRNPSSQQFSNMLAQSRGDGLRGLLDNGVYIWDAYYADHYEIGSKLRIDTKYHLEFDANVIAIDTEEFFEFDIARHGRDTAINRVRETMMHEVESVIASMPSIVHAYNPNTTVLLGVNITTADGDGESEFDDIDMGKLSEF